MWLVLGGSPAIAQPAADAPIDPDQGRRLFQQHCATCHGPNGEGGRGAPLAVPRLTRAQNLDALIEVIRDGIAGTEMPMTVMDHYPMRDVAAWVLQLGRLPLTKVRGDPDRGRVIYFSKGSCSNCHAIAGRGSAFGPDLTEIGSVRGAAYLRRALMEPQADVPISASSWLPPPGLPANFLVVTVTLRDGRRLDGIRVNEDTFSLQMRDIEGRIVSFSKGDLIKIEKRRGYSPMPSYSDLMSADELDDLTAFLMSLRVAR